ncbi:MAG: class I SAM-dependent methyltransferase [Parvibaculaceae bacterium]
MSETHPVGIDPVERFEFGANWRRFLSVVDEARIQSATDSLQRALKVSHLKGKRFLDAGAGSGLFSLAARRLGASVHSFDYDRQAVLCIQELRRRHYPEDQDWRIDQGSVLDPAFLKNLGTFDIVYSWGVLHHTGQMYGALGNIDRNVAEGGRLFIAIYNDQGMRSRAWTRIKLAYVRSPEFIRWGILGLCSLPLIGRPTLASLARGKFPHFLFGSPKGRGMSFWTDLVDWVGGYPFEVAKPEEIFEFFHLRGYALEFLKTSAGGHSCNEFIFRKCQIKNPLTNGGETHRLGLP